jgi:hypothetical protein
MSDTNDQDGREFISKGAHQVGIRVYSRNSRLKLSILYYGTKYPEMSMTTCVGWDPKMLMDPFVVGTIAMLDVTAPSMAFKVETSGCVEP